MLLCVSDIPVLLFSNKAAVCISLRFYCRTIAFEICVTDVIAKMLQVTVCTLSSRVKPSFLKDNVRFSNALETNLASRQV